jgi:spore coat polysaccharide biosynthesis protein SpsF (cytidylyltransferase family)
VDNNSETGIHVIAEMANTHEGEVGRAKQIINAVADDADAIKIQAFTADELTVPDHPNHESFVQKEFDQGEWQAILDCADDNDCAVYADIFGAESLELMDELGVDGVKIHNADISNTALLRDVASCDKPVFLSAGGSGTMELHKAITTLEQNNCEPAALIYGFQNYPTKLSDTHLRKIAALNREFSYPVGFAPHIDGGGDKAQDIPVWAAAAGAEILEVHVTVDRSTEPTDYESSLKPAGFASIVDAIQGMTPALGSEYMTMNEAERRYRSEHKKYVVIRRSLEAGKRITEDDVALKRVADPPETALTSLNNVIGRTLTTSLEAHDAVTEDDLDKKIVAVLACRAESERLYAKPMQKVGDQPILQHLIERIERVSGIHDIVLAISDTPSKMTFIDFARENGYTYTIGSEEDVLSRLIDGAHQANADTVVRVTTENPFLYWENIDSLLETHLQNGSDLTTTESLPSGTHAEIITTNALEHSYEHGEERHRSELCTLYINENPDSFDINKRKPPSDLQRPEVRLTVDWPSDLILVRHIYEALSGDDDEPIPLSRIIEFLDDNPKIMEINNQNPNQTRLYE